MIKCDQSLFLTENMQWLPQFYLFYLRFDGIFGDNPVEISLGSIITNALLRVYLYNGSQMAWWVYEITTDWNENTATWNNFSPGAECMWPPKPPARR